MGSFEPDFAIDIGSQNLTVGSSLGHSQLDAGRQFSEQKESTDEASASFSGKRTYREDCR